MRYLLKLCYDGTLYHGWQVQPNATTVQGVIHNMMEEVFHAPIEITGCGRTDTGVHASLYYAHFDCEALPENFIRRGNFLLPPDIRLLDCIPVNHTFHARFDAISRSYEYTVTFKPSPFIYKYALLLYRKPDFNLMNEAAALLLPHDNFGCFGKTGADNKTDICRITKAQWEPHENDNWKFHITSDRFLRGMVRAIVGTLLDVGYGKLSIPEFIEILRSGDRNLAGESVEACGLSLCAVRYPGIA